MIDTTVGAVDVNTPTGTEGVTTGTGTAYSSGMAMKINRRLLAGLLSLVGASIVALSGVSTASAEANPMSPGNMVRTHTGARNGAAAQDLSWRTPAVNSRHASITSTSDDAGARSIITINDSSAPTSYDFNVSLPPNSTLEADGVGGYDVVTTVPSGGVMVSGHFDAPWARDASGRSLPTSYHLKGNVLTQEIDTRNAKYPITADPSFKGFTADCGWVTCSLYLSHERTVWLYNNAGKTEGGYLGLGTLLCAVVADADIWVGAGCEAIILAYGGAIQDAVNKAVRDNGCLRWRFPRTGTAIYGFYDDHSKFCHPY